MESRLAPGMTAKCTPSQLPASGIEYAEHFPLARCVGSLKLRAAEAKRSERRLFKRSEGEVHARCSLRRVGIRLLSRCGRCAFCGGAPPASLINPATLRRLPWTMCVSECLTLRAPCIAWFLSGSAAPSMMCICMARRIPIDRDPSCASIMALLFRVPNYAFFSWPRASIFSR